MLGTLGPPRGRWGHPRFQGARRWVAPSAPSAALTGPGAAENAGQHTAEVPFRRDGWLGPIELNERTEPLTTAMATPKAVAVATKRVGSGRSRRASDRGLLPMTLESYLTLLDWTGRQLRAGTHGLIPPTLGSILDRLQVSAESWLETVARFGRRFHRAAGLADHQSGYE